jgi:hypothetical protein
MQNAGRGRDRDRVGAAARIHGLRLPHIRRPPHSPLGRGLVRGGGAGPARALARAPARNSCSRPNGKRRGTGEEESEDAACRRVHWVRGTSGEPCLLRGSPLYRQRVSVSRQKVTRRRIVTECTRMGCWEGNHCVYYSVSALFRVSAPFRFSAQSRVCALLRVCAAL